MRVCRHTVEIAEKGVDAVLLSTASRDPRASSGADTDGTTDPQPRVIDDVSMMLPKPQAPAQMDITYPGKCD